MPDRDSPATLVTTRLVRAGHEDDFARWADRFEEAAARASGTEGTLRLTQPNGMTHFVHRFASEAEMDGWRASSEHAALSADADAYSVGRDHAARGGRRHAELPSEASAPQWKSWLATWLTVFPLLLLLNAGIKAVGGGLPQPVQLAITSLIMTAVLTWFILPQLRRVLRPWLFSDGGGGLRK